MAHLLCVRSDTFGSKGSGLCNRMRHEAEFRRLIFPGAVTGPRTMHEFIYESTT